LAVQEKILIVDDLQQNLVALEALLEDCRAEIHQASSGNDALSLMLRHDYALVLLDVQMPGMDGFETAELMRLNSKTQHTPIIFVTAISKEKQYVFKGYESGAVDYLLKPIDPIILKSKVNVFLELWRSRYELKKALDANKALSETLLHQAQHDALTDLPNRFLLLDRLEQAVLMTVRNESAGALMFIDLDRFKYVNDTYGHDAGDQLLIQVSQRLLDCVRQTDTVARLGGDEFTIIIQNLQNSQFVNQMAQKIIEQLSKPFDLNGNIANISASIGITLFPKDSSDTKALMVYADKAMYQAKAAGRNTMVLFQAESQ